MDKHTRSKPGLIVPPKRPKVFTVTPSIDEQALFSQLGKGEEYTKLERAHARYESEVNPTKKEKLLKRFHKLRDELYKVLEANEIPHDKMPAGFKKDAPVNYELTAKLLVDLIKKEKEQALGEESGLGTDFSGSDQTEDAIVTISRKLDQLIAMHKDEKDANKKRDIAYHIEKAKEYLKDVVNVDVKYKTHMALKERRLLNRHSKRERRTKEEMES